MGQGGANDARAALTMHGQRGGGGQAEHVFEEGGAGARTENVEREWGGSHCGGWAEGEEA